MPKNPVTHFRQLLDDGSFAAAAKQAAARIIAARVPMRPIDKNWIDYSGFPETGRLIWFIPTADDSVAVIEAPVDDNAPYTIFHALASDELWRWHRVVSSKFTTKLGEFCQATGIALPSDPFVRMPIQFDFPRDWINEKGSRRQGMQIHAILSTKAALRAKSIVGYDFGGAYCSRKCLGTNHKPASDGCGFVTRACYFNGSLFSDGLANSVYRKEADPKRHEEYFNFTDPSWNLEAWEALNMRHNMLGLLIAFTAIIREQLHV